MGINKDDVMDVAVKSLRVAKLVAGLVPASVPLLGPAIDAALNIAEFAQEVTDSRDKCRELAERAVQFTHGIYERLNDPASTLDVTCTATHVATLLCTLQDIESLMKRRAKMSWTKLLLRKDKLKKEAEDLDKKLDDAISLFTVQSAIATEQALVQSNAVQGQLLRHAEDAEHVSAELLNRTGQLVTLMQSVSINTNDGGMTLFWKEELDFERDLNSDIPGTNRATRWQAHIRKTGQAVFVKTYRRQDDAFRAVIERSKQMMHPHIMQILGYSRQSSEHAFMVLEAGAEHQPFAKYAQGVHGVEKYKWTVDLTKQLQSAFAYMAELGLAQGSTPLFEYPYNDGDGTGIFGEDVISMDARNLFVGPGGTVRWDVYEWKYNMLPTMVDFGEGTIEITDREEAIKAVTLAKLERHLESPRPIERAAALLILWDRLMEFVDFEREDEQSFAIAEELPWVGSCTQTLSFLPFTPEGRPMDFEDDTIDWHRTFGVPHFLDFDEKEEDMEYADGPPDHIYIQDAGHWGVAKEEDTFSGPTYVADTTDIEDDDTDHTEGMEGIVEDVEDPEHMVGVQNTANTEDTEDTESTKWRRHTVIDMTYGVLFRTLQKIEELTKCRSFFLTQAVDLDIPRYIADDDDEYGPLSVVNALHFITTSYLVSLGPNPIGRPPKCMYFYERLHDEQSDRDLDIPWGYWSTSPTPTKTFPRGSRHPGEHLGYRERPELEITYLGFSGKFKYAWQQCVAGFIFRTEVIVAVSSFRPTADERLLLRELHNCLVQACEDNRRTPTQVRTSVRRKRAELEDEDEHGHSARRQRIE